MDCSQLVDDVERVETRIVGDDSRDDLQRLSVHVNHQLLLSCDADCVLLKAL